MGKRERIPIVLQTFSSVALTTCGIDHLDVTVTNTMLKSWFLKYYVMRFEPLVLYISRKKNKMYETYDLIND